MAEERISYQRRRMLLPLAVAPLMAIAPRSLAQAVEGPITADTRGGDPRWDLMRPAEDQGVTHIEIRYADIEIHRRVGINDGTILSEPLMTLTPDHPSWAAVTKAYWSTTFSLRGTVDQAVDWGLYVYTKRGLSRAIAFRDASLFPRGEGVWGSLDSDRVFVHGPLPWLLRDMLLQGQLSFPRRGG